MEGIEITRIKKPDVVGEYGFVRLGADGNDQFVLRTYPTIEECTDGTYKIGGFEKVPVLYLCDPEKNTECNKNSCQILCTHTTKVEFAKKGSEEG